MADEVGGGTGAGGGVGERAGHVRRREPAGRVGARHHDPLSRGSRRCSPGSSGIVAETGSVLSHLAILAREAGVATVVGYAGAMDDLPEGAIVRVDGENGQVDVQEEERMKIIAWVAGVATLLMGALYMIVSLNRWEWTRALFFGLIVVIAEIGLATGLVLRRLAQLEHTRAADRAVLDVLREHAAAPHRTGSPGSRSRSGGPTSSSRSSSVAA